MQKYTARRLFSFHVQMSRLESNEKAPQGQRACISTVCHFLLEQKEQGGQWYKKKGKKRGREGRLLSSERSLGARGELLQVMDALLVNQTDSEGGKVQDEALPQLEERGGGGKHTRNIKMRHE